MGRFFSSWAKKMNIKHRKPKNIFTVQGPGKSTDSKNGGNKSASLSSMPYEILDTIIDLALDETEQIAFSGRESDCYCQTVRSLLELFPTFEDKLFRKVRKVRADLTCTRFAGMAPPSSAEQSDCKECFLSVTSDQGSAGNESDERKIGDVSSAAPARYGYWSIYRAESAIDALLNDIASPSKPKWSTATTRREQNQSITERFDPARRKIQAHTKLGDPCSVCFFVRAEVNTLLIQYAVAS